MKKGTRQRDGDKLIAELSYEMNGEIDKLWNMLIEKAIICLRYFDKREPFMNNGNCHMYMAWIFKGIS